MPLDDAQLTVAVTAGNREAEAELYIRFEPRVRRKVATLLSQRFDCEDLTSEIMQAVIASLRKGQFRGECQLGTFVHAVARNKIAEYLRRRRPATVEVTDELADTHSSQEEETADEEARMAVRAVMEKLDPKYRNVLYLYYFCGLPVHQIAERLNVPARTVSERKDYALRMIRSRFGADLDRFR